MKKILVFIFLVCTQAKADVRLPAILGDHMVLQQRTQVKLWGWSSPSEMVRIKAQWNNGWDSVRATGSGRWELKIWTPAAGGPYELMIKGNNEIVLKDVMIGEVWICGGQSNMEWSGSQRLPQSLEEAPNANNTNIRFFYVPHTTSDHPQDDVFAKWVVCSPDEMRKFSAIGYFFAKQVNAVTSYPMGMISSNWGGTPAETWTAEEVIKSDSVLHELALKRPLNGSWATETAKAYNAMIFPVSKFNIAGALWYQGESNVSTSSTYESLFTKMIGSWRKAWGYEFPFYYAQIAPFNYGDNINGALLRESQSKAQSYPRTGMIVISDLVDDVNDIHPKNKKDVAARFANMALAQLYGRNAGPFRSPSYKNMVMEKDKVRISFNNANNGLVAKGGEPNSFFICGEDKIFVPAQAKIEGSQVIVWSKDVLKPVAVRFGFTNTATPNLFSKEGMPVDLFRTDNF
jgi:sialate O-acetylesterase